MNKLLLIILISISGFEVYADETQQTTIDLKFVSAEDALSVIKSLIDDSISVSAKKQTLIIGGDAEKSKSMIQIINEIDKAPSPLIIEFIASSRKLNLNSTNTESIGSKNITEQSMLISERQWVTLNTGLSIPVAERIKYADGTERQSFRFKKVSEKYVFKVHEFSGWSIIQVGLDTSSRSSKTDDTASDINKTKLYTTIVGKTGDWLRVTSSKKKNAIYLYVKVIVNTQAEKE